MNTYQGEVVLVVDSQWLCRKALTSFLRESTSHQQVVEAESLDAALAEIEQTPNIKFIIMELDMPGSSPVDSFERLSEAAVGTPILAISDGCSREEILKAIDLGAAGFISKSASEDEISHAIHAVERGEIHISKALFEAPGSAEHTLVRPGNFPESRYTAVASLTQRQRQVLEQLAQGHSNRVIGDLLKVSEHTVKIHVAAILKTLGVENRTQAALLAHPASQ